MFWFITTHLILKLDCTKSELQICLYHTCHISIISKLWDKASSGVSSSINVIDENQEQLRVEVAQWLWRKQPILVKTLVEKLSGRVRVLPFYSLWSTFLGSKNPHLRCSLNILQKISHFVTITLYGYKWGKCIVSWRQIKKIKVHNF